MNLRKTMFSRIAKEKDDDDVELADQKASGFNLDVILQGDGEDALTTSSFRNQSFALYKGSHRRRRATQLPAATSNSIRQQYEASECMDHRPSHSSRSSNGLADAIVKKLTLPFILILILVFWGPIMLQSSQNYQLGNKVQLTEDASDVGEQIGAELEGNISGDRKDSEAEILRTQKGEKKLSNPVLKALKAIQNTDFQLPGRAQENDDKFNPENLSEDEQNELQIQVPPKKQIRKGDGDTEGDVFPVRHQDVPQKILSPLQQYQMRTQLEEKLQLEHYQKQKLHGQDPGYQAAHELQLQQTEQSMAKQGWQQLQQQQLEEQKRQQLELQQQVQAQQQQLQQDKLQMEKLQQEKLQLEKLQQLQNQQQMRPLIQPLVRRPSPPTQEIKQLLSAQETHVFNYVHAEHPELIPQNFDSSIANIWDPILLTDTALFFHIPKSGGTTVADILTHCLDLVSASSIGATEGHGTENFLEVRRYHDKGRYVNVNPASLPGIRHAKELGLAASGLADVVVLHRLHEGSELFDPDHRARLFCMFRNPVHRAISMFFYLQKATWEPTYDPTLADMTLLDYANSNKVEENWITRFLVHEYSGRLTDDAVEKAKQIMRNKMVVGILGNFQESLKRFELYFDWWAERKTKGNAARMVQCQQNHARTKQNKISHPVPDVKDPAYQRLLQLNWADMQLYLYAVELFEEQAVLVQHKDASLL